MPQLYDRPEDIPAGLPVEVDFWRCPRVRPVALGDAEDWHEFMAGDVIQTGPPSSGIEIVGGTKGQGGPSDILLVCKFCGFKTAAGDSVAVFHLTKPPGSA